MKHRHIGPALHAAEHEICAHLGEDWRETTRGDDWSRATTLLLLLHERSLGEASIWYPYLSLLPEIASGATSWPEHQLCHLDAEALEALEAAKERVVRFYSAVVAPLLLRHPSVFPSELYSLEAVNWAHSMFLSRALVLPGGLEGMAPLLDYQPSP